LLQFPKGAQEVKTIKATFAVAILFSLSACHRNASTSDPNPATFNPTSAQPTTVAVAQPVSTEKAALASAYRPRIDACALLTSSEIASVQRETVMETKLSGAAVGGFDVSQCFFTLPTFTNSISLKVTQKKDANGARDPREFWRDTFHEDERRNEDERERERARERAREKFAEREKEEESAPPLRIGGIGDEAYWMGDQVGGALYVLKGSNYLRISVGGVGDRKTKIKKSTALAQKVLDRLSS
jgi:hypothetical protein